MFPFASRPECDPDAPDIATPTLFRQRNRRRPLDNLIRAQITARGFFHYDVSNVPPDGLGCPGSWLFEQAWRHFERLGVPVGGIRGDWTFGTNLDTMNGLTRAGGLSVEQAARDPSLWAFRMASARGFTDVIVQQVVGIPGAYASIDVVYVRPSGASS